MDDIKFRVGDVILRPKDGIVFVVKDVMYEFRYYNIAAKHDVLGRGSYITFNDAQFEYDLIKPKYNRIWSDLNECSI